MTGTFLTHNDNGKKHCRTRFISSALKTGIDIYHAVYMYCVGGLKAYCLIIINACLTNLQAV